MSNHISPSLLSSQVLFSVMEKVKVKKGDWVIKQGEEGDRFYIVDNGRFEVRIQEESKVSVVLLLAAPHTPHPKQHDIYITASCPASSRVDLGGDLLVRY